MPARRRAARKSLLAEDPVRGRKSGRVRPPGMAEKKSESEYSEEAREFIHEHVREHRHEGMPQDQAVAAAMSEARRKGLKVPREERGDEG